MAPAARAPQSRKGCANPVAVFSIRAGAVVVGSYATNDRGEAHRWRGEISQRVVISTLALTSTNPKAPRFLGSSIPVGLTRPSTARTTVRR